MKKLFLFRHAQTEGYSFSNPDSKRKLTEKGIQDAMKLGQFLYKENFEVDKIVSSIAIRAQTTARLLADEMKYPPSKIQIEEDLYQCSETDLFHFINQIEDDSINNLFLVNHNPAVSALIYLLTEKEYGFLSPCSLVIFSFDVENWAEIIRGSGMIEEIRVPETDFEVSTI
ncbi:phosphohistidine phosphatase SixA [Bernardetia litoralis DSM 6794]|uniref:Phosphohistidine phosphatase SixA n=1 Tax=Bernardetia litoralis (strain ATCC 23117 / DSM 6794 / NBRC 15988 / NCIMB 1366 / Fx l1 / Sio-4) TaxID=880071 RepID=I4AKI2_BERLS|nr:histidine phosphatase family protein [Bernardetia litoralis]AFM04467.1 phosphohistidine phosphatase SixA [Bernardetia litoralis DSM 6794]